MYKKVKKVTPELLREILLNEIQEKIDKSKTKQQLLNDLKELKNQEGKLYKKLSLISEAKKILIQRLADKV